MPHKRHAASYQRSVAPDHRSAGATARFIGPGASPLSKSVARVRNTAAACASAKVSVSPGGSTRYKQLAQGGTEGPLAITSMRRSS